VTMDLLAPKIKPEILRELAKLVEKPEDLFGPTGLFHEIKKSLVEQLLEGEMDEHLGYPKGEQVETGQRSNTRNGYTEKTVKTETGVMTVHIPRDRDGSFKPKVIPKNVRRLEGFDAKVLALYARGMTTREIQGHLLEIYGTEVSPQLVSEVTEGILEKAKAWQNRPLDALYPILYIDALYVSIREGATVRKKAVYVVLGVTITGQREVLGLWFQQTEGAKFWLHILTELKNRGVADVFFVCCDGLTGLPEAIAAAFPMSITQTCIVHMIRASLRFVSFMDRKAMARDLKPIYAAPTEEAALLALDTFEKTWGQKYPGAVKTWRSRWNEISPFLSFPGPIRKMLYTTNAIESLNAEFRKVLNPRVQFPSDDAALKVLFLSIERRSVKTMAPRDWGAAISYFQVLYPDRFPVA
jgi:putative transposase